MQRLTAQEMASLPALPRSLTQDALLGGPGPRGGGPGYCSDRVHPIPHLLMLARTLAATVLGVEAHPIEVEVDLQVGQLPEFTIVGLPPYALKGIVNHKQRNSDGATRFATGMPCGLHQMHRRRSRNVSDMSQLRTVILGCAMA